MPGNGKKFNPGKGSATHGQDPAGPNVLHEFQAQSRVGHQQRGKATLGDIDRRQKIIHAISKPLGKRIRNRYTSP